jgi:hypothetical protein
LPTETTRSNVKATMRYAEWLAVLVFVGSLSGCCGPRWPTTHSLPPAQRAVRFVAQALKEADRRCAEDANSQAELEGCVAVYGDVKTVLVKLETP